MSDTSLSEDLEDIDMAQFLAEPGDDEEEALWNEIHMSPTPGNALNPIPLHLSKGSVPVAHENIQQSSRHPTPLDSSPPHEPNFPHASPVAFTPSRSHSFLNQADTPSVMPQAAPTPAPADVPADLQSMSTLELQRFLISNYRQLVKAMFAIIDDPSQDRFVFDATRGIVHARIAGIEAAIAWRASFETDSVLDRTGFAGGTGSGAFGLKSAPAVGNPGAPITPSTPRPFTTGTAKREPKLITDVVQNSHMLLSSPSQVHTPPHERIYSRLPDDTLLSPRRPPAGGVRDIDVDPLARLAFNSEKAVDFKAPKTEVFGRDNDNLDLPKISSVPLSKHSTLSTPRLSDNVLDTNATKRSPQKHQGIEVTPLPNVASGSGIKSRGDSDEDVLGSRGASTGAKPLPVEGAASTSRHSAPLGPTESEPAIFCGHREDMDTDFNIPIQVEAETSNSIYKDEIMDKLNSVFGLQSFRTNQARAVDATMSGEDVFVLMPTGGGKSLCYQLPAVCTTGHTRGVTFVVSPLKSLMEDQVRQLQNKGVDVVMFNSDQSTGAAQWARTRLVNGGRRPSLVYVTPEKLEKSDDMKEILNTLLRERQLARFVIDEVHCVSTWGRDFREAYQGLGFLRREYQGVPIMALTATANVKVRADVINKLGITGCVELIQSFNRPNLYYEVRKKGKNVLFDIATYIGMHHHGQTGIIYCMSRNKCEEVAMQLRVNYSISARHYHAMMTPKDKSEVQAAWNSGECKVVVATIAFGMGIDKPDVRFVIHHQIPMSLSGYYQETGRAGRDSRPAQCILYYSYSDKYSMDRMIEQGNKDGQQLSYEEQECQKDDLRQVVQYCQNTTNCRRTQVLAYFSEKFNPSQCYKMCDNCINHSDEMHSEDMTDIACMALELVKSSAQSRPTMINAIDAFRGSSNKAIRNKGLDRLPMFGQGKQFNRELVEHIFQHLGAADALREEFYTNSMAYYNPYIVVGKCAGDYLEGRKKFVIPLPKQDKGKGKAPPATNAASTSTQYVAPVMTEHTAHRKHPITSTSKTVRSINRTEDWDHGFDSNPDDEMADVEEDEDYSVPPGFFDDPDVL